MRYTVVENDRYSGVGGYIQRRFYVAENHGTKDAQVRAFNLTEAEAGIIAFGLNAVAEDKTLAVIRGKTIHDVYLGSTEGVAS